jgi:transposase-like protein
MIESEGLTAAEVGRRLGVNVNLLRKWRAKYGKKSPIQEVQSELETENLVFVGTATQTSVSSAGLP